MLHDGKGGLLTCVLVSLVLIASPHTVDRTGESVWRIRAERDATLDHVMNLATLYELDDWAELNRPERYVDVLVHSDKKDSFIRALRDTPGISHSPLIDDVQDKIKQHVSLQKRNADHGTTSFDYTKFNTYEDIEKELKRIAKEQSNIANLTSFGETIEGRKIYVLRLSHDIKDTTKLKKKHIVLIDAGIHAREWVSVSTIMWLIHELISNDTSIIRGFLDSYDFAFMPILNPDGYSYTWTDDRLWRKNRKPHEISDCIGVDLNRNWDYEWGGEGTSDNPCKGDYRGKKPFSELETIAVKNWVEAHKSQIVVYINFHSYGQLWMTPYGYSSLTPQNEDEMMEYSKVAVDAIYKIRQTVYNYGPVYTTIYPASSISVDWVKGTEKVQLAYTVELPDKGKHGFLVPDSDIAPIGQETWQGISQLLLTYGAKNKLFTTDEFMIL